MVYRVGILGLGHWYSAYGLARALTEYPKAELIAVASPDADALAAMAATFHIDGHRDFESLLRRDDIDIVHLATPVSELADLTVRSAEAGKHIILGKPMAMTLDQADVMVEAVESSGVTCVAFQGLLRLASGGLKSRIAAGEIGDVAVMHQTSRWSIAEDGYLSGRPGWFADPRHVPGGAFIDEGIYSIDLFHWLAESEIVEVDARMANLVHRDLEVEDWGMATFTFQNGVVATLEASWTINAPRATGPSPKQNSVVRLEIVGTRGEIIDQWFRDPGRSVLAAGAEGWVMERSAGEPFGPPFPAPLDHLIDCLETGRSCLAGIREARKSFRVALAAYESARRGGPVELVW
jgi:predicted dehydrogenase